MQDFPDPLGAPVPPTSDTLAGFGDALAASTPGADPLGPQPVDLPGATGLPELTGPLELTRLAGVSELPGVTRLPGVGGLPGVTGLPGVGGLPGVTGLPGSGPAPPAAPPPNAAAREPTRRDGGGPTPPYLPSGEPAPPGRPQETTGSADAAADPAAELAFTGLNTTPLDVTALRAAALEAGVDPTAFGNGQGPEPGRLEQTTALPAAPPPAAGPRPAPAPPGRLSAGYPRGWDPPTVPAGRGWSKRAASPPPQRGRRPGPAAPSVPPRVQPTGVNPARRQLPPQATAALGRIPGRPAARRPGSRLPLLALLVLGAVVLATQTQNPPLVLGMIALAFGLGLLGYARMVGRSAPQRRGAGQEAAGRGGAGRGVARRPAYDPRPADSPLRPPTG